MTVTSERKLAALKAVATYYTLNREQIQGLAGYSGLKNDARNCRKLLIELLQAKLINRAHMQVFNPDRGIPSPVYYPSRAGLELLTAETGDESWLSKCCLSPNWQYLAHWQAIADFHIKLNQAIGLQGEAADKAELLCWYGEWDVLDQQEKDPEKRYRLFTEIRPSPNRLVCAPDAGFLLKWKEFRKVYLLEMSRGTTSISQIANSKTPGFAALAEHKLYRRMFPATNVDGFTILAVEPNANRCELLRKAIKDKGGAELWKFLAESDIKPETLLFSPIVMDGEGKKVSLIKRN